MIDHNSKTKDTILMRVVGLVFLAVSIVAAILLLPMIDNQFQLIKVIIALVLVGCCVAGLMQLVTGENYIKEYFVKNKKTS